MERMVALGLNVNVVALGQRGESPLPQAVKVCNLPAIEWLISHKANVNLTNRYAYLAPFSLALVSCHLTVDVVHSALETPLHYAVRIGQEDIILALLRAGSDVLLCAKDKQAPLDLAQNSRNPNLFRMLSGTNQPANQVSRRGYSQSIDPHSTYRVQIAVGGVECWLEGDWRSWQ